jgi:hypothetical protein
MTPLLSDEPAPPAGGNGADRAENDAPTPARRLLARWRPAFAGGMLALALTPIVVAEGRAIAIGWVPTFDAGYFTVRSRDVLTSHHPLVGAWSSASVDLGATVRNLGPLQLDLLAPFTKLDPYWGTAVGVGLVSAASVVAVWWAAYRALGPLGAGAAMLATLVLEATVGTQALIDPRQQIYLLLPYWALLWLAWAAAAGHGPAVPALVFAASLITQTHFTFVFQGALLLVVGVGLYVAGARRRWREAAATRWLALGLVVGLVCWGQPLWDQLVGDRNLGAVLAERGASEGVGWDAGAQVAAGTVLRPPGFWLPGTLGDYRLPSDLASSWSAWLALTAWFVLVGGAAALAWRRRSPGLAALGVIGVAALVAALVAAARIPMSLFGMLPQNYFWMWPTGVFLTVALAAGLLAASPPLRRRIAAPAGALGLGIAGVVIAVYASRPVDHFVVVASAETAGERVGRPAVEALAAGLRREQVRGPLVVDYRRSSFGTYLRYTFLAELQRAGIEFTFPPGDENLNRFGRERCEEGQAVARIVLADAGGDPVVRDGEVVLAHVDEFTDAAHADLDELDEQFGDWLRDGTIDLDVDRLEFFAGGEVPGLRGVLSTPGLPATGLASLLAPWRAWDLIGIPADLGDDFARWNDLQTRSAVDDVTILLAPTDDPLDRTNVPVRAAACVD